MPHLSMGRRSRWKRQRREGEVPFRGAVSGLDKHSRDGKTLVTPVNKHLQVDSISWMNDRLPEYLWAILVRHRYGRENALGIFRTIADHVRAQRQPSDMLHSELGALREEELHRFLTVVFATPGMRSCLRPLLLLEQLPGRDSWAKHIAEEPQVSDWQTLGGAVGLCLDHQSQEATDCRWLRIVIKVLTGQLVFPTNLAELATEILGYPLQGDQQKVRPSIRAMEALLEGLAGQTREWPGLFWTECLSSTDCQLLKNPPTPMPPPTTTRQLVDSVWGTLRDHYYASLKSTAPDAVLESVFGLAFFSLATLRELLTIGNASGTLGRLGLRSLAEAYIVLAYLRRKNDEVLYRRYRAYGAGQAKLSWLKMMDREDAPGFVGLDALRGLANDDIWMEFVNIELGNWAGSNLRKVAEDIGAKDVYDNYYDWTSQFTHAQWGAVRSSVFVQCVNPLHRAHRVPGEVANRLDDVIEDACSLVDLVLAELDLAYPSFDARVTSESSVDI